MLNKVMLLGRLASDPELRYTKTSGIPVANFSIAVSRRFSKDKEPEVDFFDAVAWQHTGVFVNDNFTKGQPICVEGRLQQRIWHDDQGFKRYAVEVIAESVYFAGFKRDDSQNGQGNQSGEGDEFVHALDFDPHAEEFADAA